MLALILDMLADGAIVDDITLVKIKAQLVRSLGFRDVSVTPAGVNGYASQLSYGEIKSIPESVYPCFGNLISLLDSWHKVELPSPVINMNSYDDGKGVEVLIGSPFADIPINILATYERVLLLPVLVIKHLLESIHVIIYKHDFEGHSHNLFSSHFFRRAIMRSLDLLITDVPFEVRQIAFLTIQSYFRRATTLTSPLILYAQFFHFKSGSQIPFQECCRKDIESSAYASRSTF